MTSRAARERRNLVVLLILLVFPIYSAVHQFATERRMFIRGAAPYDLPLIASEVRSLDGYLRLQPTTGFFSELEQADPWNGVEAIKLQYAAAPHVLVPFQRTEYVLARFQNPAAMPEFTQRQRFSVVKAFPDGVALLKSLP